MSVATALVKNICMFDKRLYYCLFLLETDILLDISHRGIAVNSGYDARFNVSMAAITISQCLYY